MFDSKLVRGFIAFICLVALLIGYVAWQSNERVIELPPQDVRAALSAMPLPSVFSDPNMRLVLKSSQLDRMNWVLEDGGKTPTPMTMTLEPVKNNKATRVKVAFQFPDLGARNLGPIRKWSTVKLFEATMLEQVKATVNNRNFQWTNTAPQLFVAIIVNLGALSQGMDGK